MRVHDGCRDACRDRSGAAAPGRRSRRVRSSAGGRGAGDRRPRVADPSVRRRRDDCRGARGARRCVRRRRSAPGAPLARPRDRAVAHGGRIRCRRDRLSVAGHHRRPADTGGRRRRARQRPVADALRVRDGVAGQHRVAVPAGVQPHQPARRPSSRRPRRARLPRSAGTVGDHRDRCHGDPAVAHEPARSAGSFHTPPVRPGCPTPCSCGSRPSSSSS